MDAVKDSNMHIILKVANQLYTLYDVDWIDREYFVSTSEIAIEMRNLWITPWPDQLYLR